MKKIKNLGSILKIKNRAIDLKNSFKKLIKRNGFSESNMDKRKEVQINSDR